MPSLEFDNLPLIEVSINLVLTEPIAVKWSLLEGIREALRDRLPIVTNFFSGLQPAPIGFVLGAAPGASFENEIGVKVDVRHDRISSTWLKTQADARYVRFGPLLEALKLAYRAADSPRVRVVNMAYVNRAPSEHGTLAELLRPEAFPSASAGRLQDYNAAWTLEDGVEFRLQCSLSDEGAVISSAAGLRSDGDWETELDAIHEALQQQFSTLITDHAKEVWQWQTIR
ncbi:MAG: hypothetical protein K1X67_08770 [Fimbriimonadaceae bacterium]|nr:hypothetical protein [Fimbriimonadaceae bacterium]